MGKLDRRNAILQNGRTQADRKAYRASRRLERKAFDKLIAKEYAEIIAKDKDNGR